MLFMILEYIVFTFSTVHTQLHTCYCALHLYHDLLFLDRRSVCGIFRSAISAIYSNLHFIAYDYECYTCTVAVEIWLVPSLKHGAQPSVNRLLSVCHFRCHDIVDLSGLHELYVSYWGLLNSEKMNLLATVWGPNNVIGIPLPDLIFAVDRFGKI